MTDFESPIIPVVLCGGSGTRLWPLSRKAYPKQFTQLIGEESLFQVSARRLSGPGYAPPMVITGSDYRFIATEQLVATGETSGTVLIEPEGRNTAPAILAAAMVLAARDPGALMLVAPSDHVIPDTDAFQAAIAEGVPAARSGQLVTFGIRPTAPETGYGYLELSAPTDGAGPVPLTRFVEKPHATAAGQMVAAGNYLWNAGIFLFSVEAILAAFEAHAPDLMGPVGAAVAGITPDLTFQRLAAEHWSEARDISIDYAVMEKAANISVVPFDGHWSDLGGWDAVWKEMGPDDRGVSLGGDAQAIDCDDTLLRSETEGLEVVGLGLKDIMVVATGDAVLVADKSRAQDVKQAISVLKAKGSKQAVAFPRDYRPWGWYETLALSDRFQVKRIVVKPGAALSLQSHVHRSEHWIVVAGTAKVTVDDTVRLVTENQSVYIPLGAVHRMENPGKLPMVLIEVQTGAYLGEDDIIRYEDVYDRS
ncbi:mannose-1-phosphate guanylyltransferase/mannose-6-phosphate isomerase [Flavimaricola sp.]|nr:mannose-1-phosphate guanylyltransferase/mannose-6-phosphate isomerase [Flavimaricola sp.]MDA9019752.1 mannose-1-phosphate guanylyltransferase/mannose-6-phosphate isomerase [Flavimaricola sp.]